MALPKLQTSEYKITIPSTQEEIKFRPFLVKEQKILMIAQESGDESQIGAAVGQLVDGCTFGSVDANVNPMFDIEYVFLQLRAKSVGSKIQLKVICPDDNETQVEVEVDIDDIQVQMSLEHTQDIEITDDISIHFRYPKIKDLQGLSSELSDFERTLILIVECVDTITSNGETINRIDMTQDEIVEFVDSMNSTQMEGVLKFFETMPKVRHIIDVVNPKTKKKGEVLVEGIESFLE
jgi:hypothetical protein